MNIMWELKDNFIEYIINEYNNANLEVGFIIDDVFIFNNPDKDNLHLNIYYEIYIKTEENFKYYDNFGINTSLDVTEEVTDEEIKEMIYKKTAESIYFKIKSQIDDYNSKRILDLLDIVQDYDKYEDIKYLDVQNKNKIELIKDSYMAVNFYY